MQITSAIEVESSNNCYADALRKTLSRTPEEILAEREKILTASRKPAEVPEGKTLADMVVGKWPGDETDEVIFEALRKLS